MDGFVKQHHPDVCKTWKDANKKMCFVLDVMSLLWCPQGHCANITDQLCDTPPKDPSQCRVGSIPQLLKTIPFGDVSCKKVSQILSLTSLVWIQMVPHCAPANILDKQVPQEELH